MALVFVTVGNATQGFRRLLDKVDELAGQGFFAGQSVVIQSGSNRDFKASHSEQETFLPPERFTKLIGDADVVISHAGAGTLIQIFGAGKVPVVMPRRKQYLEHVDDHQVELVSALAAEGRVIPAYEPGDLKQAIEQARERNTQAHLSPPSRMIALVSEAIEDLCNEKALRVGRR